MDRTRVIVLRPAHVFAVSADENAVAPGSAADDVELAVPRQEAIVSALAEEAVASGSARDLVVTSEAADQLRGGRSCERIASCPAAKVAEGAPVPRVRVVGDPARRSADRHDLEAVVDGVVVLVVGKLASVG